MDYSILASNSDCFKWRSQASAYVDGLLLGNDRDFCEKHVEQCSSCRKLESRYRQLIQSVQSIRRTTLPVPPGSHLVIAQAADHPPTVYRRVVALFRKYPVSSSPWYVRSSIEAAGIGILTLILVSLGPRIKVIYDRGLERSFDASDWATHRAALTLSQSDADDTDPMSETTAAGLPNESKTAVDGGDTISRGKFEIGEAEIVRFNIRGDNLIDLRGRMARLLQSQTQLVGDPAPLPIDAPGGIQYDFMIAKGKVQQLKLLIEKDVVPQTAREAQIAQETHRRVYTWFKNKSRKPQPPGLVRIVIWLSQL